MSSNPISVPPRASSPRTLLWILLLAFVVRGVGAFGQGAPYGYYGDETSTVERALYFGAMGTADPGWFNKPALTYYLLFAVSGAIFVGGRVLGLWTDTLDFGAYAVGNIGPFLVAGRLMNAVFGAGTAWLVYLIGRRLRDRVTGLVAALVFAILPGDVLAARVLKEDAITSFFMTAAVLFLIDVVEKGRAKDYLRAGFAAGLAMAAKYNAAALVIPAVFAHVFRGPDVRAARGTFSGFASPVLGVATFVGGFFVGAPYCFLNPLGFGHFGSAFGRAFRPLAEHPLAAAASALAVLFVGLLFALRGGRTPSDRVRDGGTSVSAALGLLPGPQFEAYGRMTDTAGTFPLSERIWYGLRSLTVGNFDLAGARYGGLGSALTVVAGLGFLRVLARRSTVELLLVVVAAGHLVFVAAAGRQLPEPRHLAGVYPCAAYFAAVLIVLVARFLRRNGPESSVFAAAAGVLALLAFTPTNDPCPRGGSLAAAHFAAHTGAFATDTRTLAMTFLERHAPPGATVINFHDVVPLRIGPARARFMAERQRGITPGDPRNHQRGYARKWAMIERASERPGRPVFDVLSIIVPWQGEDGTEKARREAAEGFQNYWPISAATAPQEVPPIERYRRTPWSGSADADRALAAAWPAARHLLPGSKADWLIVADSNYDNYLRPEKRLRFPDFAAFFDDLKAHYDALEWKPSSGRTGPVMRVYDLRTRRAAGSAQILNL